MQSMCLPSCALLLLPVLSPCLLRPRSARRAMSPCHAPAVPVVAKVEVHLSDGMLARPLVDARCVRAPDAVPCFVSEEGDVVHLPGPAPRRGIAQRSGRPLRHPGSTPCSKADADQQRGCLRCTPAPVAEAVLAEEQSKDYPSQETSNLGHYVNGAFVRSHLQGQQVHVVEKYQQRQHHKLAPSESPFRPIQGEIQTVYCNERITTAGHAHQLFLMGIDHHMPGSTSQNAYIERERSPYNTKVALYRKTSEKCQHHIYPNLRQAAVRELEGEPAPELRPVVDAIAMHYKHCLAGEDRV
mmetsp:Transcript_102458/g.289768  ORF Transcript_102458/g.289768 Transcript_102458/m.289768 type:complete len:298 (-) Transcript_102458:1009-1902(-)